MQAAPLYVFGTRLFLCRSEQGEALTFGLTPFGRVDGSMYYIFDGAFDTHVSETGEVLTGRSAGFISTEETQPASTAGSLRAVSATPVVRWVCIPDHNKARPSIQKFELQAGQQITCPAGTRVFVAAGSVQTAAGVIGAAGCFSAQVDTQVTAISDVRGLRFL